MCYMKQGVYTPRSPGARLGLAVVAALFLAGVAWPAQEADEKEELRQKALLLNRITGEDPIQGKIDDLVKDPAGTRKLLGVAVDMAREKDQPFNYNACLILARAARGLRDSEASLVFYRLCKDQAIKLQSSSKLSEAYLGLVNVLYDSGKLAESEKLCREFLEIEGDETLEKYKIIWMLPSLVEILARQGKIDEATKLVNNLVKFQPDNWLVLELKAGVLREAGKFEESAKVYEDVLKHIEEDRALEDKDRTYWANQMRYVLSGVYVDLNQIDKAAEQLKALLAQEPDSPRYNNDLGYIWADHDMNLEEAEKLIRKAIEEDRKRRKADSDLPPEEDHDNGAYLDSLGWVLYKQKKYEEAKKYLLLAVEDEDAQHIEIYDHLGDVHMALGEKDKAIAAWKKGLELATQARRDQERKALVEKKLKAQE